MCLALKGTSKQCYEWLNLTLLCMRVPLVSYTQYYFVLSLFLIFAFLVYGSVLE